MKNITKARNNKELMGILQLKFGFKFASDWLIKYRLFLFSSFSPYFCKNLSLDLIPPRHLVLNPLLFVICFFNMPSTNSTTRRERGKNYTAHEDRILIEIVIEHAEEIGLFDKVNYAWKTRIAHSYV